MKRSAFIVCCAAALFLMSCDIFGIQGSAVSSKEPYAWGDEKKVDVRMTVAPDETIYLVKYNPTTQGVPSQYTGGLRSEVPQGYAASVTAPAFSRMNGVSASPPLYTHHQAAMEFNAAPPPAAAARTFGLSAMGRSVVPDTPAQDEERPFWVQNASGAWVQINAKLVTIGTRCYVWIATGNASPLFNNYRASSGSDNNNKVTADQAVALAEKFDQIYPYETALFGFEKGGGQDGDGGIDGDPKIHILVYDINEDYRQGQTGGTVGFFWGKDEYVDGSPVLRGLRSNAKEIFYIDAHFLDKRPTMAYSTLVHEFQHMIHFNQKNLRLNKATATWYNEMLSMLAEDTISPRIGVAANTDAHPIKQRIPYFNALYYAYGVTEWRDNDANSYSQPYAFGAYLMRNYGGAELIYQMAHNDSVDVDSVDAALKTLTGDAVGFTKAFEKFPEVLLNMQETTGNYVEGVLQIPSVATFNNTVPGAQGNFAGYDFTKFDLSEIPNAYAGRPNSGIDAGFKGPKIFSLQQYEVRGHGIDVQNCGTSSTASIIAQLTYHANSPVKMYFLGKKSDGTVTRISDVYPQ